MSSLLTILTMQTILPIQALITMLIDRKKKQKKKKKKRTKKIYFLGPAIVKKKILSII